MTDDVKHETGDDLFADDELSDEALDRAAEQGGKATLMATVGQCLALP